jgi:phosphotriesterase-related protein
MLDFVDVVAAELKAMTDLGGNGIVELTCGGIKPDPKGLTDIALMTGVKVIMGCGYYVDEYQDERTHRRQPDDFAREIASQIFDGAWGTRVRAGIIGEIGSQYPWTDLEKRVLKGAVVAQQETGSALNVHPGRHPDMPQAIADFVRAEGGDLTRTIISHIDRTIFDFDRLFRLADSGVVVEYDLFGRETTYYGLSDIDMPNDGQRLEHIRALIERGHLDQIVISHDICTRTRLLKYGGHGYGHIFENVFPLMRERGFTQDEIDTIMISNPRRLLTFV